MVPDRLQALRIVLSVRDGAAALAVAREFTTESAGHWNGDAELADAIDAALGAAAAQSRVDPLVALARRS